MDRRQFLQTLSASIGSAAVYGKNSSAQGPVSIDELPPSVESLSDYTYLTQFEYGGETWKAYEDLRSREGNLALVSEEKRKILSKTAEPMSARGTTPYLGFTLEEVVDAPVDLLAQRLLEGGGDPDEDLVKSAVPPLQFPAAGAEASWLSTAGTFVGTKECWDTQPMLPDGSTNNFMAAQYCPAVKEVMDKGSGYDGLVGGWLPVIRKVFPMDDGSYCEILGFPDIEKQERFIVHTWHRITQVNGGKVTKVAYQHTYRPFKHAREEVRPEEFYRALLASIEYWQANLREIRPLRLPRRDWADMTKHAFVKELIVRPGGVYPKYGAVDRNYGGSEHDGFPDTLTTAVYANLEWGRFETAKAFIESYFDEFVDVNGAINYRGPEIGQYGLMLALIAKYYRYTGDQATLLKYREKLQGIQTLLVELHDASLKLPSDDPGRGLIHGWSEADACLTDNPTRYWQPYFGNSALAARGFRDLGGAWRDIATASGQPTLQGISQDLAARSKQLQSALIASVERSARTEMNPPYLGALPGMERTFDEDARVDPDSPQKFSARAYNELLQADMLPPDLANLVIDCLRAYGGTTLGIPCSFRDSKIKERSMLGFCSYGYAQTLLRHQRVEEFLLFLYAHRYHTHQRGHWTARESVGISRRPDTFVDPYCTPAQQTVPLLIRWMLVLEDSDEDRLYLGRGLPRSWVASGKEISIKRAPTRWGGVSLSVAALPEKKAIRGLVEFERSEGPGEFELSLRGPAGSRLRAATVNGHTAKLAGVRRDVVVVRSGREREFEVNAEYA